MPVALVPKLPAIFVSHMPIDPIHAVKAWNQASFSWIERHAEGDGTMMLRRRNMK